MAPAGGDPLGGRSDAGDDKGLVDIDPTTDGIDDLQSHGERLLSMKWRKCSLDWMSSHKRESLPKISLRARWHTCLCLKRQPTHIIIRSPRNGATHSTPRGL